MFKLRIASFICKNIPRNKNLCRRFSPLTQFDVKYEEGQKKTFMYSTGLILSLGICYIGYNLRQKESLNWSKFFKRIIYLPQVRALEPTYKDTLENVKVPPRAKFNFLADVVDKTAPSVVYVEIIGRHPFTKQRIPISNGSGFIVKSDGLILTNAHVVSYNGRVVVKLFDGREFEGTVEHFDTESDLATVRIKADNLPVLPLGHSSNLRAGEFVIAMGNPLTLSHTITAGVISSVNRQGKELGISAKSDYIQTDAAVNVGNSGGPLVNLDCEAIGINTMKVTEGISFAIPSDRAIEFLNRTEKIQKGSWNPFGSSSDNNKQKYLGITMLTLSPSIVRELQERIPDFPNVAHGVMVWRVMINSPSHECGIKRGDVITSINGKEIYHASDVYTFLNTEEVLHIHIVRKNIQFDITVKLIDPLLA